MALYRVEANMAKGGKTVVDGANVAIVSAEDVANAKLVAAAANPGISDAAWAAGTVAEIVAPTTGLEGFRLRLQLKNTTTNAIAAAVTVTGAAAADMDALGALAETALNATALIGNASYTAGTNVLIVAAVADGLGDHKLYAELLPPLTWDDPNVAQTAFISTIVDEGIAGADVTVLFVDAATPGQIAAYNQGH